MNDKRKEQLLKQINLSGFAFQLRVAHAVRQTEEKHSWRVITEEHHWTDPSSGESGYIDIVLDKHADRLRGQPRKRMVIECKRLRGEASWIFVMPEPRREEESRLQYLRTDRSAEPEGSPLVEWHDGNAHPATPEAAFCVVQGQTDRRQPMLERLCDTLLPSLEGLASESLQIEMPVSPARVAYIPVIVTTATLVTCVFDPGEVSLRNGELQNGEFREVPFIRSRKALSTKLAGDPPRSLAKANLAKERTVFVVHAADMEPFLGKLWLW